MTEFYCSSIGSCPNASKFSYDGETFAVVTDDAKLLLYDLKSILDSNDKTGDIDSLHCRAFNKYHKGSINDVEWSKNGKILATCSSDAKIKLNFLNENLMVS